MKIQKGTKIQKCNIGLNLFFRVLLEKFPQPDYSNTFSIQNLLHPEFALVCSLSQQMCLLSQSCKWNYAVCSLLCLSSLTQHNIIEIYLYFLHISVISFILLPSSIPFYRYTTISLYIHQLMHWLFSVQGNYKLRDYDHFHTVYCMNIYFQLSWVNTYE